MKDTEHIVAKTKFSRPNHIWVSRTFKTSNLLTVCDSLILNECEQYNLFHVSI